MKLLFFAITLAFSFATNLASAQAKSGTVRNCMEDKSWMFFTNQMEEIAQEKKTSVLLMDDKDQVVGVISVTPDRAETHPFAATSVSVEKISLCADFEVTDFYYTDGSSANLLEWTSAKTGDVFMTQDEGQLVITAKVGAKESYATRIDVEFLAYDVMTEIESYTPAQRKMKDFDEEWGLPKGKGKFHFFIPAKWKFVP